MDERGFVFHGFVFFWGGGGEGGGILGFVFSGGGEGEIWGGGVLGLKWCVVVANPAGYPIACGGVGSGG